MQVVGMVFTEIITTISFTGAPTNMELVLGDAITNPLIACVNSFGSFLLDAIVGDTPCSVVVRDNRGWALGMSEFFETEPERDSFACIVINRSEFAFGARAENFLEDSA